MWLANKLTGGWVKVWADAASNDTEVSLDVTHQHGVRYTGSWHSSDVIMGAMVSQITSHRIMIYFFYIRDTCIYFVHKIPIIIIPITLTLLFMSWCQMFISILPSPLLSWTGWAMLCHAETLYIQVLHCTIAYHDDVINWKLFRLTSPLCGEFTGHPVNSPHKGQWRRALMFSLICPWTNGWVNNRETGDLRRHRAHYDATVMWDISMALIGFTLTNLFTL